MQPFFRDVKTYPPPRERFVMTAVQANGVLTKQAKMVLHNRYWFKDQTNTPIDYTPTHWRPLSNP